jgi:hypothetical protein
MWGDMQTTWENNSQAHIMFCSEMTEEEQQYLEFIPTGLMHKEHYQAAFILHKSSRITF